MTPFYEPGTYKALVTGQQLGKTKTGKPQFVLRVTPYAMYVPSEPDETETVQGYERLRLFGAKLYESVIYGR